MLQLVNQPVRLHSEHGRQRIRGIPAPELQEPAPLRQEQRHCEAEGPGALGLPFSAQLCGRSRPQMDAQSNDERRQVQAVLLGLCPQRRPQHNCLCALPPVRKR